MADFQFLESIPFKFKMDEYTRRRGKPNMLVITCAQCSQFLMCYQKDGPGPLKRCYLDRIHYPEALSSLQHCLFDKGACANLICASCKKVIGVPMMYEKEDRPAYRMRIGCFRRQKLPADCFRN